MSEISTAGTFLFPESRKYPVDEVCEQIVRALHARDFAVPGLTVETVRLSWTSAFFVRRVHGANFELEFEPRESAAGIEVSRLHIPGRELRLSNYEQHIFLHLCHENPEAAADADNHRASSLCVYRGSESGAWIQPPEPRLPVYLIATEDSRWSELDRPQHFLTRNVFIQFNRWLREHVLDRIQSTNGR